MIIVHDGKAHRDDFLAAAVCYFKSGRTKKVYRQKFTQEDLDNPQTFVLDQGRSFDPDYLNFDHHQLDECICAFTQVLDYYYGKEYRKWFKWPAYIETYDAMGPNAAKKLVKCDDLTFFDCPIANSLLELFSNEDGLVSDFMHNLLYRMGSAINDKLNSMESELALINKAPKILHNDLNILDIRNLNLIEREGDSATKVWERLNPSIHIDIILADCNRNKGSLRMISTNTATFNFSILKSKIGKDISFVHNTGFLISFSPNLDFKNLIDEAKNG